MKRALLTSYSALSALGTSGEDFASKLRAGHTGLVPLADDDLVRRLFGVGVLGLLPGQDREDNTLHTVAQCEQKRTLLKKLFAPLGELAGVDTLLLVHNAGPNPATLARAGVLYRAGEHGVLQPEDVRAHLLAEKKLSAQLRTISFHNTCASGTAALAHAAHRIRAGVSRRVLVVGFEVSNNNYYILNSLSALGVLNGQGQTPAEAMTPFDRRRRGFVKGDGLCALLLEAEGHESARPVLEVAGGALSCDAHSLTDGIESGERVAETMRRALADAHAAAEEIDLVSAHGSGTQLNDLIEVRGLRQVFGDRPGLEVQAAKAFFGHTLCVSGLLEVAALAAQAQGGFRIGNIHLRELAPEIPFRLPRTTEQGRFALAIKNSFGFGGYNASLVVRNLAGDAC